MTKITKSTVAIAAALALLAIVTMRAQPPQITQHRLPNDITFPEGVAHDAASKALYTGSAATGAIVRIALDSGQSTIVSAPGALWAAEPFPALLGMKIDGAGRLWVSGGRTGRMAVIDARSGNALKKFQTPAPDKSLINDVVVTESGAYFTDSFTPTLWRVTTKGTTIGELEPWLDFTGGPLEYTSPGANLNGIAATPDGRTLIVVQMNKGLLFRIPIADKKVVPIDVGGEALTAADGLVLDGRTLYIVRQGEQEIVTLELSPDLSKGRVVSRFKDPALMWPATAAKVGDRLMVVNTQFNKRTTKDPVTPFAIIGVPIASLAAK